MPYFALYRDVDAFDKFLLVIGSIGSAGNGIIVPLFTIVLGEPGGETLSRNFKTMCGELRGACRQSVAMKPRARSSGALV